VNEVVRRRPRSLAHDVVDGLAGRVRDGSLPPGAKLPTEAAIMEEFGVSRTVVREAITRLQQAGLVATRHGVGTFVVGMGDATTFRISPDQLGTLQDVIAVLELRIAVETECAALAAVRRSPENLATLRNALEAFLQAVAEGRDAVGPDFQFHLEIARATQNQHFVDLMATGAARAAHPRARGLPAPGEHRARKHRRSDQPAGSGRSARRDAHAPGEQPGAPATAGGRHVIVIPAER
jgi:GntR family transcriptional repressor for pyruvate dehydrogenase complex